ncbi:O-antigen ligase [Mesorhizobium sp. J18]|uniref:O-antigen ligase family protein n=1 Tax=Mesorhizobium sp. J18 TaxID=935263 RepID=UPI001198DBBD|nr:O-antigen ligase [Mesorhizobium sp. J18]TWG91602.1 O-antigen ligase [Mesorhizobium sp. J18]
MKAESETHSAGAPRIKSILGSFQGFGGGALRRPTLDEMNRVFTVIVLGWAGVVGSVVSILFIGAILHAFLRLFQRKIALPADRGVWAIAVAFVFYCAADAISGTVNYDGWNTLSEVVETLPFLGFAFVYGRLSLSERKDVLNSVEFAAISGSYLTLILVIFEFAFTGHVRAEGMAGNSGVLALIAAILYGFCLLSTVRRQGKLRWLALTAAVAAGTTLLLTGTRALWPFLVIAPFIPLAILRPRINWPVARKAALIAMLPIIAVAYLTFHMVEARFEAIVNDFEKIESGDYNSSIGDRLILWRNGLDLAAERPILGQGPGAAQGPDSKTIGYTHFHNFLLNAMVRSGLLGVAAILGMFIVPLWVLIRRRHDEVSQFGIAILVTVQTAFLLSGSVGIMLGHDIHDALFIYATITASFLVLGGRRPGPEGYVSVA